jgi:hypothetical protein
MTGSLAGVIVLWATGIELLGVWQLLREGNDVQILWSITAIASLFAIVFILTREWR